MSASRLNHHLIAAAMFVGAVGVGGARAEAPLSVVDRWTVGGPGGWDYLTLDASGERLFVTRGTRVDVIDTRSGKLIGTIPDTDGVHGVALAPDLKRGFTSNGKANTVTAFDLGTLKTIKEAPVSGLNPDAIVYDTATRRVFTFNGKSHDVTVLDPATLAVVGTLSVPDKPEFAVTDGAGTIFANIESDPGQMAVIDSGRLKLRAIWALPGCARPTGLSIDREHHRLFSVCEGKVMAVTDAMSGKPVAQVPIGEGPDAAAFDAKRKMAFSSNGEGTLTVVHQDSANHYTVAESVPTQRGARTMALDAAAGRVYLATSDFGPVPAATPESPHPRAEQIPGTFTILIIGRR